VVGKNLAVNISKCQDTQKRRQIEKCHDARGRSTLYSFQDFAVKKQCSPATRFLLGMVMLIVMLIITIMV
jgi:hypothetical protein